MPSKCLFQAFCWAITGVQWYILIFWFISPFICASLQAYGIYSNCIYLMLQGCATYVHSHVRWRKWMSLVCFFDFLFDFCLLFYFPTYISFNSNAFSLFFFWSLCFSGSFFIPFSSHKPLHGDTLCRACKIDGFFVARYSGKRSEVNNVAISWKNENKTEGNRLVCPLLFWIWLDILFFAKYQGSWA